MRSNGLYKIFKNHLVLIILQTYVEVVHLYTSINQNYFRNLENIMNLLNNVVLFTFWVTIFF
jgi:hypothetical protein